MQSQGLRDMGPCLSFLVVPLDVPSAVVQAGTDKHGRNLVSAGSRLSKLAGWELNGTQLI
jgi:hypothetical protein